MSRLPFRGLRLALLALSLPAFAPSLRAQLVPTEPATESRTVRVNRANWALAERIAPANLRRLVGSTSVQPRFFEKTDTMFYRWQDGEESTWWLVAPLSRSKRPLFDHQAMAEQLTGLHKKPYTAKSLPIQSLNVTKDHRKLRFQVDSIRYEWDLRGGTLASLGIWKRDSIADDEETVGNRLPTSRRADRWKAYSPDSTAFAFARDHQLFVVEVATGDTTQLTTDGEKDYSFGARDTSQNWRRQQRRQDDDEEQGDDDEEDEERVRPRVEWSPDSKRFLVQRGDSRKVKDLYLVDVLAQPRPVMRSYKYAMPGEEEVTQSELYVYTRGDKALTRVPVEKFKDQRLSDAHWPNTSDIFRVIRRARTQREVELVQFDAASLDAKVLINEQAEASYIENQPVRYVRPGGDFLWFSERSGWGHYYLYGADGTYKRPFTSGAWRADGIASIDTTRGTVWVVGVGREEGPSPYYRHVYRVNGDGSGFTHLTRVTADHAPAAVSPNWRYFVATRSRADTAPVSEVRDANTGQVLMTLESPDMSRAMAEGWRFPEPFTVKAADGVTDIYGNLYKPHDFDSTRKYPIINYVYPGPQTEAVTSSFSTGGTMQRLANLGFIVVQIGNRGGSPQRDNAYHSYGYYNLRDYAIADKKAGLEQLAMRHPFIDIERVGIYGHSGGGFLTAAAMMLPPYNEFFKVGVSSAGNHDNNIYNQNWSEQHHGLRTRITPPARGDSARRGGANARGGAARAGARGGANGANGRTVVVDDSTRWEIRVPTNGELARNLKGKLLIVHGDMDDNVHPGNSVRLVDALISANKRFDFMLLPGQRHGFGPRQEYFNRMLMEYFAEHLLGDSYRSGADY
jgi:dipeptidyl aminopeptidase/acylaminoacyl peptidase